MCNGPSALSSSITSATLRTWARPPVRHLTALLYPVRRGLDRPCCVARRRRSAREERWCSVAGGTLGGRAKRPSEFPSMLPLLSSPLAYVFSLHSGCCGTGPRLLWRLPVVWGPRVSNDFLSVRALTPVNRFSRRLECYEQLETLPRPACQGTSLDAA